MITSQVFFLKPLRGNFSEITGKQLHGLLFSALADYDKDVAAALHKSKIKPFSISFVERGKNGCWFRVASWEDAVSEAAYGYFAANAKVHIGKCDFSLIKSSTDPNENPWAVRLDLRKFIQLVKSTISNQFWFEHASPTAFKVGDSHLPLPIPQLIANSICRQLPDQLREEIDISPDQLAQFLQLKRHRLISVYNRKNQGSISSFTGRTQWQISGKASIKEHAALWLLANFAFFSGIGVKTTQGMGMCRII